MEDLEVCQSELMHTRSTSILLWGAPDSVKQMHGVVAVRFKWDDGQ